MALTHGCPLHGVPLSGPSGAEEDGFALEGFDGEEQGYGGIDAGGDKNEGDGVPVIGAGHDFLADQAGVENGNKRELGGELDAWHDRGYRWNHSDKGYRREVALGFRSEEHTSELQSQSNL